MQYQTSPSTKCVSARLRASINDSGKGLRTESDFGVEELCMIQKNFRMDKVKPKHPNPSRELMSLNPMRMLIANLPYYTV